MASKDFTDSDTSDEEYIPGGIEEGPVSEEESDGDPEDVAENEENNSRKKPKRRKQTKKNSRNNKNNVDIEEAEETIREKQQLTAEDEKKKVDSLWADFLKDTDFKPKVTTTLVEKKDSTLSEARPKLIKEVKKIFEFAGEKVEILSSDLDSSKEIAEPQSSSAVVTSKPSHSKRNSATGISSLLNQITKKQKITTLEKSKLDWDRFKKAENIEDELKSFNKGKNGYLERQDFLERADMRRFEIEKKLRATNRSNRS